MLSRYLKKKLDLIAWFYCLDYAMASRQDFTEKSDNFG